MVKKHSTKEKKDNLGSQIIKLKDEIEKLKEGWQRTQADFDNYRKRTEGEKLENLAYAKAEFITKLTPVLDNFRRAFEHMPKNIKNDSFSLGVKQIQKQLEDILCDEGLKKIVSSRGTKFNPECHEAISCEENKDIAADCIIGELESGWIFSGRVLKPAKVRVSKGK